MERDVEALERLPDGIQLVSNAGVVESPHIPIRGLASRPWAPLVVFVNDLMGAPWLAGYLLLGGAAPSLNHPADVVEKNVVNHRFAPETVMDGVLKSTALLDPGPAVGLLICRL